MQPSDAGDPGAEKPRGAEPRKGTPGVTLDEAEFRRRFLSAYQDQAFEPLLVELDRLASAAWDAYEHHRKSPHTRKAGEGFHDPDYELSVDWIEARDAIAAAEHRHDDPNGPARILLISGSSRSEHTCPGEMSKTWRLTQIAKEALFEASDLVVEELELHRLAAEYGRQIHPCKACFSTAPPLCHWPCSCYPNYSLGQTHDWMNDIYPMWVEAHGVMIVTPVNWYQVSSPVKLMMDRLVCADGGNPDPTLTQGKNAALAKTLELRGWDYPRHLAGRLYAVVAHGDAEGAEGVRRSLSDWLTAMHLVSAGRLAELDRYIGYYEPYALNHEELDSDEAIKTEVRNAARTLLEAVLAKRAGKMIEAGKDLREAREK
ncbi:MAG: flavodoxin family protein [Hyphomicrobiales bacterium]|nr:flavodoxin family protein [Hyphomicrobiales bacterium]